ncbi:hypothetical protein M885DRAFT_539350 [Pelagophyceae sp. CCMP2097]|nr:hypothetical protein M885DRAFT_539350 [Pelagophyceae sp. CCMP2097]
MPLVRSPARPCVIARPLSSWKSRRGQAGGLKRRFEQPGGGSCEAPRTGQPRLLAPSRGKSSRVHSRASVSVWRALALRPSGRHFICFASTCPRLAGAPSSSAPRRAGLETLCVFIASHLALGVVLCEGEARIAVERARGVRGQVVPEPGRNGCKVQRSAF